MSVAELLRVPDGPFDMLNVLESEAYTKVEEAIAAGSLPADTFLRLDAIGDGTMLCAEGEEQLLRRTMLLELSAFTEAPEHLTPLTRNTVFSKPPRAMLVWDPELHLDRLHNEYQHPFLIREDLASVIKERRIDEGKTVTEVPNDRRWRPPEEVESAQCMRIAHGLWSVLCRRIMPEWLKPQNLDTFYRPHRLGSTIDLGTSRQIMNRRIVGAIALRIDHIRDVYDESLSEGVRGIGPVGRQDLRTLLAEQYPELH